MAAEGSHARRVADLFLHCMSSTLAGDEVSEQAGGAARQQGKYLLWPRTTTSAQDNWWLGVDQEKSRGLMEGFHRALS